mgnify:CR=1 FL=1
MCVLTLDTEREGHATLLFIVCSPCRLRQHSDVCADLRTTHVLVHGAHTGPGAACSTLEWYGTRSCACACAHIHMYMFTRAPRVTLALFIRSKSCLYVVSSLYRVRARLAAQLSPFMPSASSRGAHPFKRTDLPGPDKGIHSEMPLLFFLHYALSLQPSTLFSAVDPSSVY